MTMREIIFRGKRKDNGNWVCGKPFWAPNGRKMVWAIASHPDFEDENHCVYYCEGADVLSDTIGQFTGLTDKYGTKIFEGDIVRLDIAGIIFNAVCKFHSGSFGLVWHYMGTDRWQAFTSICHVEYEVIGNIYDNPEMMEGE